MVILATLLAVASPAGEPCRLQLISSAPGENHVLFHGLSPDGRTLAVGWDRGTGAAKQRGAFLLALGTGKRSDLPHLNNAPSFSPNGRFLVSANYPGDKSLKTEVVELDRRTGRSRTYASGPSFEWLASYSRDGKSILFNSTRSGTSDLYRVSRSDGSIQRITDDARYEAHGQWFDRGRQLIFHRQTDGDNYDIVLRDLATRAERTIGATALEEAYPAISPDGRWIAFSAVTKAGTQPHLFVMGIDGGQRRQLTDDPAKDAYSTWSPDGRSIYFVRFSPDGSKIYRIDINRGACRG